jgi:hypothetical protein
MTLARADCADGIALRHGQAYHRTQWTHWRGFCAGAPTAARLRRAHGRGCSEGTALAAGPLARDTSDRIASMRRYETPIALASSRKPSCAR